MTKKLFIALFSFCVMLTVTSCVEKYDAPEDIVNPTPGGNDDGEIGEVITEGYADLGLSVKWAVCNLGASSCFESGTTYKWGDQSTNCELDICGTSYDQATDKLGKDWQLPSYKQAKELIDKCKWTYTQYRGIYGYVVTGPSGKAIFLTNRTSSTTSWSREDLTTYWTGNCDVSSNNAYTITIGKKEYSDDYIYNIITKSRSTYCYIRPVYVGK